MRTPSALDDEDEKAPANGLVAADLVPRAGAIRRSRRTGRCVGDSSTSSSSRSVKQQRRRARWRARWWRRVGVGCGGRRSLLSHLAMAVMLCMALVSSGGFGFGGVVVAMVQQAQIVARCRAWVNSTCHFAPLQPIQFTGLDLSRQTLCKVRVKVLRMISRAPGA